MKMHAPLLVLSLATTLACSASEPKDPTAARQALADGIAFAESSIQEVRGQEAVNLLTAAVAEAELHISLVEAEVAIREVQGQAAVNHLNAALAQADLTLAAIEAQQAIASVSDDQLLRELDMTLANADDRQANDMIMAVVSERPVLASTVQERALAAGWDEALVANALSAGFGEAAATAAGKQH